MYFKWAKLACIFSSINSLSLSCRLFIIYICLFFSLLVVFDFRKFIF